MILETAPFSGAKSVQFLHYFNVNIESQSNRAKLSRTRGIWYLPLSPFWLLLSKFNFFFYLGFLSRLFTNHRTAGESGWHFFNSSLPLSPASHLDISRAITEEILPLHIIISRSRTGRLVSERMSLTNKLRALKWKGDWAYVSIQIWDFSSVS